MPTLSERIDCMWHEIKRCESQGENARANMLRKELGDVVEIIAELGVTGCAPSWEDPASMTRDEELAAIDAAINAGKLKRYKTGETSESYLNKVMRPGPRLFSRKRPFVTVAEMLKFINDQGINADGTFVSIDVTERAIVLDTGMEEWRIQC